MRVGPIVISLGLSVVPALAHEGVTNMAVMPRMDAMSTIAENMKTLGQIAKGQMSFDASVAEAALQSLAREAARTPDLFRDEETDPKSEALPVIWEDFDDFTKKSIDMEEAATGRFGQLTSAKDVAQAVEELGATCRSCHSVYRKP